MFNLKFSNKEKNLLIRKQNTFFFFFIYFYHLLSRAAGRVQLVKQQTAFHAGHMCEAPSASTASPSFSKTLTSAFSFYGSQHMSLLCDKAV